MVGKPAGDGQTIRFRSRVVPAVVRVPRLLSSLQGFAAGTVNNQAGAFSPLSLTMSRADGDQQLGGVSMHLPTGLLGTLSTIKLCQEPQASQGTCGLESEIGDLTVAAGAGATPFYVHGGKVFATGPYKGAPYGLSVVVPREGWTVRPRHCRSQGHDCC